jgi:hypothetical protein
LRQQLPGRRQPDATADALGERESDLCFEPREVVADRWLGVSEFARRGGHRAVPGQRREHFQSEQIEHP